jgi:hypothetical protein
MSLSVEGAVSVDDAAAPKVVGGDAGAALVRVGATASSAEGDGTSGLKSTSSSITFTALGGEGCGFNLDLDQLRLSAFTDSDLRMALPADDAALTTSNCAPR